MVLKINNPNQGEIWLFDPDPVKGKELGKKIRPCLIVSNNLLNKGSSGLVIILPITSSFKGIPSHVCINPPEGGLDVTSYALCEQIRCISKERLVRKLGSIQSKQILKEAHAWIADFIKIDS
jgi:mRNA interferase MazF